MSNLNYTSIYSVNNTDLPSLRLKDYTRINSYGKIMNRKNNEQSQVENHIFSLRIPPLGLEPQSPLKGWIGVQIQRQL
jgi:hypothetical protein